MASTQRQTYWGVDLGGTKVECAVIARESDRVLSRLRIPTESEKGYEHILDKISEVVNRSAERSGFRPARLGIGTPGCLDPATNVMKNCNSTALNGRPLKDDLQQKLGIPVVLANDANCFALAETHRGVVRDLQPDAAIVFGIIMGTGVGGGVVVDGKVLYGCHGIAGEWGHNFLDASGGPCYCGRSGCVETVISGIGLQAYYRSLSGKELSLDKIAQRHTSGEDEAASRTIERLVTMFGKAVAVVINLIDPHVIVIGGGVGNIDALYSRGVEETKKHIFNPQLNAKIVKPKLGDSAGVFGAALLVK